MGRYVTIGQGCVLRSATIEDEVLIGEKCVLMEGSLVENHSILAPGSVLPPGRLVPSGQLWAGNPAKFVRNLSKDEVGWAYGPKSLCALDGWFCCSSTWHNIHAVLAVKLSFVWWRLQYAQKLEQCSATSHRPSAERLEQFCTKR